MSMRAPCERTRSPTGILIQRWVLMEFRPVVEKARQAFAELVEGDQTPMAADPGRSMARCIRQAEAGRP